MRLGGEMGPNMGTTVNKIASATNGWKLNSASHIYSSSMPTGAIGYNLNIHTNTSTQHIFHLLNN
ncbi:hypothetical protein E2C01_035045 [Portunus trituberculatus]|uniref:Uncharacterized protein n=1 Tax=Portunus trituberculatus TaxID=210409 RepID=A0A5B7F8N8_PORTR|nr:hypothetical protein [Portunus trituberculatus]